MDKVLVTVGTLTLIAYGFFIFSAPDIARGGLETTVKTFIQALPWIIVSMFAAGLMAEFLHPESISKWLGRESGLAGILIGAFLGLFGTGSRWAVYPLGAGLLAAKSSPGAVFSFLTSWQLISLARLPAEVPFLGEKFTFLRACVSLIVAIIGGIMMNLISHNS